METDKSKRGNNLISLADRDPEDRRRIQSMGGKASAKKRQLKKSLRDALIDGLEKKCTVEGEVIKKEIALILALIDKGIATGDPRIFETIRDTIGETQEEQEVKVVFEGDSEDWSR